MIAIIDNGYDYSDHEIAFVRVRDKEEAELAALSAQAARSLSWRWLRDREALRRAQR